MKQQETNALTVIILLENNEQQRVVSLSGEPLCQCVGAQVLMSEQ